VGELPQKCETLNLAVDRCEWVAARCGHLTPEDGALGAILTPCCVAGKRPRIQKYLTPFPRSYIQNYAVVFQVFKIYASAIIALSEDFIQKHFQCTEYVC
jgi:hypothetical protein